MPLIEYIGSKPSKEDNVAGTGAVWSGAGDAQEVPESAVAALLAHKTGGGWPRPLRVRPLPPPKRKASRPSPPPNRSTDSS